MQDPVRINISDSLIYWLGIFVAIGIIGIFAVSYYSMRLNLKASYRIHLERERLRGELETAREMQMGIMPSIAPDLSGIDIAGVCLPAIEVGGDYFDYFQKTDRKMFTALLFGVLDLKQMQFTFTNAGQLPPMLLRDGKISELNANGPRLPLGAIRQIKYNSESIPLKPGDRLLIYTDGINEALNQNGEQFGNQRLANAFYEAAEA